MSHSPTALRAMSVEQLRTLRHELATERQQLRSDLFCSGSFQFSAQYYAPFSLATSAHCELMNLLNDVYASRLEDVEDTLRELDYQIHKKAE
jgi:hypothetical protein